MPCTRSMASKGSRGRGRDAPQPSASPPPPSTSSRTTRNKKVSKPKQAQDLEDEPPLLSGSSARSTRARTRSKVERVVEEVEDRVVSPPPPKARTTRQKAADALKVIKSVGKMVEATVVSTSKSKKPTASVSTNASKKPGKNGTSRKVESQSEELFTDEDDMEVEPQQKPKVLTLDQLHRHHVKPLKTALDLLVGDVFPKCYEKIMDTETEQKRNEDFERLMSSEGMPPPPPPKGKGRKKRARSPEPVQTRTDIPTSFNFAESTQGVQAKKKMCLGTDSISESGANDAENRSEATTEIVDSESESITPLDDVVKTALKLKQIVDLPAEKKFKKQTPIIGKKKKAKEAAKKTDDSSASEMEEVPVTKPALKWNTNIEALAEGAKKESSPKPMSPVLKNKSPVDLKATSTVVKSGFTSKRDTGNAENEKKVAVDSVTGSGAADVPKNSSNPSRRITLDETFVVETPKEDKTNNTDKPINTTYTPELFGPETPKSSHSDSTTDKPLQTIHKSKDDTPKSSTVVDQHRVLAPATPEPTGLGGVVSSLVNFFDKSKKENDKVTSSTSKTDKDIVDKMRSISPELFDSPNNHNATYVLPSAKIKSETKTGPSSMLNVTVSVKKGSNSKAISNGTTPILPPPLAQIPESQNRIAEQKEVINSRTFVKDLPGLAVLMEDEERKDARNSNKSDKARAMIKPLIKAQKKGTSSSSSSSVSSGTSMKSAVSELCLSSKKLASSKNIPSYGSAGKLHEVHKSKPDEVEKRKQELLNLKTEQVKKHNKKVDEVKKNAEKIKLEEEKRNKEKQKLAPILMKKPAPPAGTAALKSKLLGVGSSKFPPSATQNLLPAFQKPFFKAPAAPTIDLDADDSFKTASNSFLETTVEGPLSSYDITVYEDLDDELKYRDSKPIPRWAAEKDALHEALFSMVLASDFKYKLPSYFPKPDKNYRLFPNPK